MFISIISVFIYIFIKYVKYILLSENKNYPDESEKNYKMAVELSQNISWISPLKLGLYLNYSVFYYEIKKDVKKAIQIAKEAIKSAKKHSDKLKEEDDKDAEMSIQTMKENIIYWEEE